MHTLDRTKQDPALLRRCAAPLVGIVPVVLALATSTAVAQPLAVTGVVDDVQMTYGSPTVEVGDAMRASISFDGEAVLETEVDFDTLGLPGQSGQLASYRRSGTAQIWIGDIELKVPVSRINIFNDYTDATHTHPIDAWSYVINVGPVCDPGIIDVANLTFIDIFAERLDGTEYVDVDSLDGLDGSFRLAAGRLDTDTYECLGQDPLSIDGLGIGGTIEALGAYFDVMSDHWAYPFIRAFGASGITRGCGNGNFCPTQLVARRDMAIFLERAMNGADFSPPRATGKIFDDVLSYSFGANYIEQFYLDAMTAGCGGQNFCPLEMVSRAQMAVFLLRAMHGAAYMPPPPTAVFADVDLAHWAVGWIEQLAAEGVTGGCGNGNFCPEEPVTRAQMALFLVRAFDL